MLTVKKMRPQQSTIPQVVPNTVENPPLFNRGSNHESLEGDEGNNKGDHKRESSEHDAVPPIKISKGSVDKFTIDNVFCHEFQENGEPITR